MSLKISTIEHNPSALRGFLNNPKWYAYGHRLKPHLPPIHKVEYCKIKWCGCGDELRSEEDLKTKTCWICRSVGRNDKNKTDI